MIVGQDRTAHDGQIGVGTQQVVRELIHEIKKPNKAFARYAHRHMIAVEYDAMLIVIGVGGILEIPALAVQTHRHDAVVLARGKIHSPRVAGIFNAQHAFGIAGLLCIFLRRDIARILFRLGQVDRDFQFAHARIVEEAHVLCDSIHADVIHVSAHAVEILRRGGGAQITVELVKAFAHHLRVRRERAHQLRGEKIAPLRAVRKQAALYRVIADRIQYGGRGFTFGRAICAFALRRVHMADFQQTVHRIGAILARDQMLILAKIQKRVQVPGHRMVHLWFLPIEVQ